MSISIVGSGSIGTALARHFAHKSLAVSLANTRGVSALAPLAAELGASVKAADLDEALQADMVILALPFSAVSEIANKAAWAGRIVIDATNAIDKPGFTPTDFGGKLSSAVVAETLAGSRVVKAFNTLPAAILGQDPEEGGARRVLFLSGDDPAARKNVAALVESLGFAPLDLGSLSEGRPQQFGGPLVLRNLLLRG